VRLIGLGITPGGEGFPLAETLAIIRTVVEDNNPSLVVLNDCAGHVPSSPFQLRYGEILA
jgi:hypothetical protein